MKCMCAQTRPRFILSSEGVLGGMEFDPMLTPREKSPLPEKVPRGGSNPRRCGQRAQALPTELFRPPFFLLRFFLSISFFPFYFPFFFFYLSSFFPFLFCCIVLAGSSVNHSCRPRAIRSFLWLLDPGAEAPTSNVL